MDPIGEQEALRRRLYRPGASEADRQRYSALVRPEPDQVEDAPARSVHRAPVVLVALVTSVVAVSAVAVGRAAVRPETEPAAVATPTALVATPPPLVLTVGRTSGPAESVHGTGSTTVALDVSAVTVASGTFAVVMSAADERPVGWKALGLQTRRDWSSYRKVLGSSPARDRRDATRADPLAYRDDPPRWIDVQAAADASWTLTVVAGP
jgi:hypothetical protein